jgi:hypothetical protein
MSTVIRCDWCGEEAHPEAPVVEFQAVAVRSADDCASTDGWVGHYHAGGWWQDGQRRNRNCFARMRDAVELVHEYAPAALESVPVASPQKIAQLRRKHTTPRQENRDAA